MNTIKTVLTTIILALFLANCVQLDFIVNCKTVGQNKNIKENKEAPDKSWSVTIANQDTYKSSISTTSMMVLTRKTKTIKYDRLVLTYLCSILLTNSYAPEPNPGPPKYPCGSCNKACTWKQKAVCCDSCDQWYHINCQGIDEKMYKILDKSNLSWNCINCGMPNFSTTFFNSTIPELSNTYSELEISNDSENESTDNIGLPTYTSSPIQINQTQSSSTTKKKQGKN